MYTLLDKIVYTFEVKSIYFYTLKVYTFVYQEYILF